MSAATVNVDWAGVIPDPQVRAEVVHEVERFAAGLDEGDSCLVTGSLVEGLGNTNSDIDLYVVLGQGRGRGTAIGLRATRYVDCEYMDQASLTALAERFRTAGWDDVPDLTESQLDRHYRLAIARPVVVTPETAAVQAQFDTATSGRVFSLWAARRALEHVAAARVSWQEGSRRAALAYLREAALWRAATALAQDGEGYPSLKWTVEKAARRHGRDTPAFRRVLGAAVQRDLHAPSAVETLRRELDEAAQELARSWNDYAAETGTGYISQGSDAGLLALTSRRIAPVRGVVATVCRLLTEGVPWPDATQEAASGLDVPHDELRIYLQRPFAALWEQGFMTPTTREDRP